jgi:hypothetical protein
MVARAVPEMRRPRMEEMDVDFYRLERPIQDRFSDATRSIGLPTPILWEAPSANTGASWLLIAAPALGALG